ncbi:ubiquinone anaerobic biosynthesis protein UbiV [Aquamicrobium defluvii]|uniref:Ubiquinone biosynthesis protein UbiV n=1 Tax=Aquamicrobium defluvii TaxID=69279 RepID=A0A011U9D0_9HYPH|nr:U32 family peptidase [Aquamicrobium defluvii]EXL02731.1 protease [Aquamicrobium defluvii]EZQ13225.1 protease [Halopseudomonas bauzanensis]
MNRLALTLGPLFFHWPAEKLRDFYFRIADEAPFERVHIGEVVCGKRMPFSDPAWPEIIERLEQCGKEVVLSTLAAPATVRERKSIAELCADGRVVEINDITALPARSGRPFVTGPFLNVYNEATARFLQRHGATGICPPVELSLETVGTIAAACPEIEFELFAFGRLPLALSGRCYHARLHGLHKDSCQFTCEQDPDGLSVDTLDDQSFLAINGVQTLSDGVHAALFEPADLAARNIRRLRLSPHGCDMVEVTRIYRDLIEERQDPEGARFMLSCLKLPGHLVDGYTRGKAGALPAQLT